MISVTEARERIREKVRSLPVKQVVLQDAAGLTLAADVYAPTDIPGFIQSSVDGYALSVAHKNKPLEIVVEMAAGTPNPHTITGQQAARIFTGAPLPIGADTVVMQEYCIIENGRLLIQDADVKYKDHVRPKGSEITQGTLAMQAGEQLTTAAIGFLAGIGIDKVPVYPAPRVSLLVTGKEIRPPGTSLTFGQVYDSNSIMLGAALRSAGITQVQVVFVDDTLDEVKQHLATALLQSDIVLLTGGISVGDYDFVLQATKDCGVAQHFHKVKQKPGKPFFFGTKEDVLVFGLPVIRRLRSPVSLSMYCLPWINYCNGQQAVLSA